MAEFSKKSLDHLKTCHVDLQRLFMEVIKKYDCSILEGYRGREEQEKAVKKGNSEKHYPESKHNKVPSLAVDVAPYPVDWKNRAAFMGFVSNSIFSNHFINSKCGKSSNCPGLLRLPVHAPPQRILIPIIFAIPKTSYAKPINAALFFQSTG